MGALKKVPPRLAGVEKKFEKKVGFVGSSHCLAGSKAHVFALLWAPGRLVRWTIYLRPKGRFVRKSGPGPSSTAPGFGNFGVLDLSKFEKY